VLPVRSGKGTSYPVKPGAAARQPAKAIDCRKSPARRHGGRNIEGAGRHRDRLGAAPALTRRATRCNHGITEL
jgi:hypothetical protein